MTTITSDRIQKLTNEQQETLAEVELRLARRKQQLLEQARSYRGYRLVPSALVLIGVCLYVFRPSHIELLGFCILAAFALIQFHAAGINRRVSALLELLETDIKSPK